MLDVVYDNDMKNYLRKTQLEFTVFDDNAIGDEKDSDVIGTAAVSLLPLLEGREIREKV